MTGIQWTDETWNPATGCDRVSPGCDNCYALTMAARLKGMGQQKYFHDGNPATSGPGFGVVAHLYELDAPFHWRKPRRVFVNSMGDLFHEAVPETFIGSVFDVMARTPQHTYQILTKRHGRMRSLLRKWEADGWRWRRDDMMWCGPLSGPLPNVWLGVSAEDQKWADIRIPALLDTPAAVRFLSAEPLLGPMDIHEGGTVMRRLWAIPDAREYDDGAPVCQNHGVERCSQGCTFLDWVIAGGESGPGARPCQIAWLRSLRDQCAAAEVPFFCKQLGSTLGREMGAGSKGGNFDAFPDDLRIREFPRTIEQVSA